jgi:hypothetical protein
MSATQTSIETAVPWERVEKVFASEVLALMKSPDSGTTWLQGLRSDPEGIRLAVCITIDLLSGALDGSLVADILNHVDPDCESSVQEFGRALDDHPRFPELILASQCAVPELDEGDQYVRVMYLRDFATYYVWATDPQYFADKVDLQDLKRQYFSRPVEFRTDRWWSGARRIVWVTARSELDALARTPDGGELTAEQQATAVADGLGLGPPVTSEGELVAICYPAGFDRFLAFRQPTSLDAGWQRQSFYLSYLRDDGWGRTHSCSGERDPARERVHSQFKGLGSGFVTRSIGRVRPPPTNRAALLHAAVERLEKVLGWQD